VVRGIRVPKRNRDLSILPCYQQWLARPGCRGPYRGWNVKHFHEHLRRDHGFRWGYTFVKAALHTAGLVERAKRRGAHRRKRERKPCEGMMLHQDGSRAAWLVREPMLDLIATMDDASASARGCHHPPDASSIACRSHRWSWDVTLVAAYQHLLPS
jgi:hypothetical protein